MIKRLKFMLLIYIVGLTASIYMSSYAQGIFPSQKELTVTFSVSVERTSRGFNYMYTLKSSPESKQTVRLIAIDNKGEPGNVKTPSTWRRGGYVKGSKANKIVSWFPGRHKREDVVDAPINSIEPGQTSEPFGLLEVSGPPTIVEWHVKGWAPVPVLDEDRGVIINPQTGEEFRLEEWSDTVLNHSRTLPNNPAENFARGTTLGPSKPPTDQSVICDTFILDLIVQVREAAALGWVKHDLRKDRDDDDDHGKRKGEDKGKKKGPDKDDEGNNDGDDSDLSYPDKNLSGVAKSIIKKLTMVRRECLRGEFGHAREKLRVLIKQVNAQRGKHLTEEAYALIRFNAEFLLEKI